MRAISLWQPWASAVGIIKLIETRHWATDYRGPLVIHATRRWTRAEREFSVIVARSMGKVGFRFPLGALVCVIDLIGVRSTQDIVDQILPLEKMMGNYEDGRFGWMLSNYRPLREPIPYTGRQGFFNVPDELIAGALA